MSNLGDPPDTIPFRKATLVLSASAYSKSKMAALDVEEESVLTAIFADSFPGGYSFE